ncbi:hypothetical protein GJ697_09740 [Pseudoduganella sp. FT25W]|jgi:hypothetical protein|uniref:Uncharacterized protein n=1 Tax=Duganella alba TaxID=2666081 RepID=A0A6L5QEF4_9BURK|nr:hypothetical protein [Duganella alba]MRX08113.1 hypothetical protein [Duganella alba]MRX16350.1 hypothetical protein [Duganella alba]
MKKYLLAGALAACLSAPVFAANNKFVAQSPEEPLHKRSVLLCMAVLVGLHYLRHMPNLPTRRPVKTNK